MRDYTDGQKDDGFGLVEVIIAITLLGLLLAAIAPVVLASLTTAAKMSTIASANQVAVSATAKARIELSTVTGCQAWVDAPPPPVEARDDRGRKLLVTTTLDPAAACGPSRVAGFTISVTTAETSYHFDAGATLVETGSYVMVRPR